MNQLIESCKSFESYPQNLRNYNAPIYRLKAYFDRLQNQHDRLFDAKQAAVDVLDYKEVNQDFALTCVTTLDELKDLLSVVFSHNQSDPQCRFVFIHAPNSRAALKITRPILNFFFSYHQVMPEFLDFIFPFGKQENARDAHFSGLREDSRIQQASRGLYIEPLNRSGRELRLCYNLRSVERSPGQQDLQWSVRQTAVYHSFDLEAGRSLWINVKGNKLMKNRVFETIGSPRPPRLGSTSQCFSTSLAQHMMFCEWAGEEWRWYINDLENKLHASSKNILTIPIDGETISSVQASPPLPQSPPSCAGGFPTPSRSTTKFSDSPRSKLEPFQTGFQSRATTLVGFEDVPLSTTNGTGQNQWACIARTGTLQPSQSSLRSFLGRLRKSGPFSLLSGSPEGPGHENTRSRFPVTKCPSLSQKDEKSQTSEPPHDVVTEISNTPATLKGVNVAHFSPTFTFNDRQRIEYIEEKLQEALLELELNTEVLRDLRQLYRSNIDHTEFPPDIRSDCEHDIVRFEANIVGIEKDLRIQQLRTKELLRVLGNRKKMLNDILQYRSTKACESFAKRAQESADKMEKISHNTHEIAQKTKHETVSMRIITLVTLFFLPGTFVAVRSVT